MILVAVLLAATIAGGWYLTRPAAERREAERKHDEEVARAAAKREAQAIRNRK
jgi:hypothetical protein